MNIFSKTIVIYLSFFSLSTFAAEKTVNLSVYIAKKTDSSEISIEVDNKYHLAFYNKDKDYPTFDDVNMTFTVTAPLSSPDMYSIVLNDMSNNCNGVQIDNVVSELDGNDFPEGDIQNFTFDVASPVERSKHHQFTLSFPHIPQTDKVLNCTGHVAVKVEATI
ncbi:hypothetical protein GCM10007916_28690 [Psychromonas marina]|uniref:Uncharacterized protein n=1 Tax=Psychromonas marina TaxID=88364 RepID=A0ABQ6E309_9GAMM|nr:hypothetical protein [Psychromonas marina]GLS91799.1 hypothetical protein GCM10007916_28690 [Psychromonas marina]